MIDSIYSEKRPFISVFTQIHNVVIDVHFVFHIAWTIIGLIVFTGQGKHPFKGRILSTNMYGSLAGTILALKYCPLTPL